MRSSAFIPSYLFPGGMGKMQKVYIVLIICLIVFLSTWMTYYTIGHQLQTGMIGIDDEYGARLNRVKEFCKMKQRNNKTCNNGEAECSLRDLIVDENNRIMLCAIPKVATSIWSYKLIMMSGKKNQGQLKLHNAVELRKYNLFQMPKFSKEERAYRMRKYFKFVFVRHPLTRLVSAYREKIEPHDVFHAQLMLPFVMKHLRHNTDKSPISFQEFASYILRGVGPMVKDRHWATYNELCRFCEVQYDFIGRQEFLEKDASYLVKTQFHKPLHANFNNTIHRTHSDLAMTRKYFSKLTEETKQGLIKRYGDDMEMFGYKSSDVL